MIGATMQAAMNEQIKNEFESAYIYLSMAAYFSDRGLDGMAHEQFISGTINDLVKLAQQEGDFAAMPMLNWFVEEQIEEEDTASKNAQQMKLAGGSGHGLIMLDRELGARTFAYPPAALGGE